MGFNAMQPGKIKKGDIVNVDVTVILQTPKLSPHKQTIRQNLAHLMIGPLFLVNELLRLRPVAHAGRAAD